MGKGKKGRKQNADDEWPDDSAASSKLGDLTAASPDSLDTGIEPVKKSKKKLLVADNWEDELADDEEQMESNSTAVVGDTAIQDEERDSKKASGAAGSAPGGKKGKKGKKKDRDDNWEDEITAELEEMTLGVQPSTEKKEQDSDMVVKEKQSEEKPPHDEPVVKESSSKKEPEEESNEASGGLRTAAQKRADKKEREKEKKKAKAKEKVKPAAVATEETKGEDKGMEQDTIKDRSDEKTVEDKSEVASKGAEAAVAEEDVAEDEGDGDKSDKKKKKKKKKIEKEEKAAAGTKSKKPAASAIKRMKENLELLRLEQKRREEEEAARIKAEEEAEEKRLEKLRLEQERKEKKKQKEKERRERLKKEGKLLTKAEKEKKVKMEAQLKALQEQGVQIPGLGRGQDGDGTEVKKKPVRYGTRVRDKQKKGAGPSSIISNESLKLEEATTSETQQFEREEEGMQKKEEEESLKDNWDDEDPDDVDGAAPTAGDKDVNWDDDEDEDESDDTNSLDVDGTVMPVGVASQVEDSIAADGDATSSSDSEASSKEETDESDEEDEDDGLTLKERVKIRVQKRNEARQADRTEDAVRSPIVCVLGHVDTGKTKILDKIRHTNVQDGEAGGITQQIGATFVPDTAIREQTTFLKEFSKMDIKLPGLLIIDTPGHEAFSNLRTRGSAMCDIAILVVDLMHGLEPQTIESLNILKKKKIPFVVALNKIDRLYDWRRNPTSGIRETMKKQKQNTKDEFDARTKHVLGEFSEQGTNAALFWEKVNFKEYCPVVPTSAISGDGMGDLIALLVTYSQKFLLDSLLFSECLDCNVLEVKAIAGLGTTVDVILRDGILREGQTIVLCGSEGPIVTQTRALLMPQPLRELRVKNAYVNHKLVPAAQGVKITGKDLEKALAGFPLFVVEKPDEVEYFKDEVATLMKDTLSAIHTQERGVYVQASTLGSLEALLGFLKESNIPYCGVNIGPVHKRDVVKCSVMLEHDSQFAVILAFDVRVEREAQEMADSMGVRIFTADIIYHLFDNFMKYRQELKERDREKYKHIAVFPCKLRILPDCVFNARDPIVVGVIVEGGIVKSGTPIVVPSKDALELGVISSIEINHKVVEVAHRGQEVAVKIENSSGDAPKLYGRHFDHTDVLVSKISRESINAVKNYFREDLQKSDWHLMVELKKLLNVY